MINAAGYQETTLSRRTEWLILLGFVTAMLAACIGGGGPARYVWLVSSVGMSYWAWQRCLTFHFQTVLVLFSVAPLLRRLVDINAGYDPSGLMLAGPLLALMVPMADLFRQRAVLSPIGPRARPFILALLCISYGVAMTALLGDVQPAIIGGLKVIPPVVYGLILLQRSRMEPQLFARSATTMGMMLLFMSIYGIVQYVDPQPWDRAWMIDSRALINSIGDPEPFKVRVFSTTASPASFATMLICGCLLLSGTVRSTKPRPYSALAILLYAPIVAALFLTTYRTAWLALMAGMLFLTVRRSTRTRGLLCIGLVGIAIMGAVSFHLSDGVVSRLDTFAEGMRNDDSTAARIQELWDLYESSDNLLLGSGYSAVSPGGQHQVIDGTIVECIRVMGVPVGSIMLFALVWAAAQAIYCAYRNGSPPSVALGALNVASLILMPLASVIGNELGFLFWSFAGLAAGLGEFDKARPPRPLASVITPPIPEHAA